MGKNNKRCNNCNIDNMLLKEIDRAIAECLSKESKDKEVSSDEEINLNPEKDFDNKMAKTRLKNIVLKIKVEGLETPKKTKKAVQ